jgi:hypothetical protein
MKATALLVLAALALGAAGCGSTDTTPAAPPAPATFSAIYAEIFPVHQKPQCNFCHSNPPNKISNGNLSMGMDQATAYAAIVNKPSTSDKCAGKTQVVPGHPEQSLFYLKLLDAPPCGDKMPLGGDPLTADELEQVRSWIANGAADD